MSGHMKTVSPNEKLSCRSVWISDIHLGSTHCKAKQLLQLLNRIDFETLYLVGDIVDLLAMQKRVHWPDSHNRVVRKLMKLSRQPHRKVIYVPGNHDYAFRTMVGSQLGDIEVHRTLTHQTVDQKRLLVSHGDELDYAVRYSKLNRLVGDIAYHFLMWSNEQIVRLRERLGFPYWSLATWVKRNVNKAEEAINAYQLAAINMIKDQGYDGIVCGHLHYPTIRHVDNLAYYNDGDWVENCTALIETHDGAMKLYKGVSNGGSAKKMIFVDATAEFTR